MASVKFYLDKRAPKKDGTCPVKLYLTHNHTSSMMPTNISVAPANWDDAASKITGGPCKSAYNSILIMRLAEVTKALAEVPFAVMWKLKTARQLRNYIMGKAKDPDDARGSFCKSFESFTGRHANKRTKEIYAATWHMIEKFDAHARSLSFEDVNKAWLERFDIWLSGTSPSANSRAIHLRNIRAVFNDAIDNEMTVLYPFRRFKIRHQRTAKRNLKEEQLVRVFTADVPEWKRKYLDFFRLQFYLIGINTVDLLLNASLVDGRVEYLRAKTGRYYSIKAEPEALEIIGRYRGTAHLLNVGDGCKDYRHFSYRLNMNLHDVLPGLTSYYARHSWATIAARLDIPRDTIAAALGHGENTVTDIYIEFDMRKVDEANRKVIDYVNGLVK